MIIYQHDIWCQRWPHPSSLQSGTLNVLQAPNLFFLSQIMTNLDQTFRICPLATTNIIFDVQLKITPSFKSPARNPQRPRSPQLRLSQRNQVQYWSKVQDRPLSSHQHSLWCSTQDDPILQVSSQEPLTSSNPQLRLTQPNHVQSWSNFQDSPLGNNQHRHYSYRWKHWPR